MKMALASICILSVGFSLPTLASDSMKASDIKVGESVYSLSSKEFGKVTAIKDSFIPFTDKGANIQLNSGKTIFVSANEKDQPNYYWDLYRPTQTKNTLALVETGSVYRPDWSPVKAKLLAQNIYSNNRFAAQVLEDTSIVNVKKDDIIEVVPVSKNITVTGLKAGDLIRPVLDVWITPTSDTQTDVKKVVGQAQITKKCSLLVVEENSKLETVNADTDFLLLDGNGNSSLAAQGVFQEKGITVGQTVLVPAYQSSLQFQVSPDILGHTTASFSTAVNGVVKGFTHKGKAIVQYVNYLECGDPHKRCAIDSMPYEANQMALSTGCLASQGAQMCVGDKAHWYSQDEDARVIGVTLTSRGVVLGHAQRLYDATYSGSFVFTSQKVLESCSNCGGYELDSYFAGEH
jgi:hypothetical protein